MSTLSNPPRAADPVLRRARRLLVPFAPLLAFLVASPAPADQPRASEWRPSTADPLLGESAAPAVPLSDGTTWVRVHPPGQSPCAPEDASGGGQTVEDVWCFEGANGDSSWPARGGDTRHDGWDHWSRFAPPAPGPSRWHVTTVRPGAAGGTYNAWCGCDSVGTNPACADVAFWIFRQGYGDRWNYSLTLDMSGQDASAGGVAECDLRYDAECNYDYVYLEYLRTSDARWVPLATFNGVSGQTGPPCGGDYFASPGFGFYGNSQWIANAAFPLPAQAGGMQLRWRGTSDKATSDADGRVDTDGLVAIDNVTVTFAASGVVVSDDFESGDFDGVVATSGTAAWTPGALEGNPYDGWHLEFDPKYKNKGSTCYFSDDWMWAAKPAGGAIPSSASGFDFLLVTPAIDVSGWTGGVIQYSSYHCLPDERRDYSSLLARSYDGATSSWSPWQTIPQYFLLFGGCDFWSRNTVELTPYLGSGVDSLQVAWELLDGSVPGNLEWGVHTSVQLLVDNVAIGRFDADRTVFTARRIDIFGDTFSRVDPAHTPFLANAEEGMWIGNGGTRAFASADSLSVDVMDLDGISAGNVQVVWRVGSGTPPIFGAWSSKAMVLSEPDPVFPGQGGLHRTTIGNTTTEDYSADEAGSFPNAALDPIWDAGQVVQYYVRAEDDLGGVAIWPAEASAPEPEYLELSVLPQGRTNGNGESILLVDDFGRDVLDFENSDGFRAGGPGMYLFTNPAYVSARALIERSLAPLYGGSGEDPRWDVYAVPGAGSSVQREPRVLADAVNGLGGIADGSGAPRYDAVLWIQGYYDRYSYADTTRIELETFLDHGGRLFSTGDDVAYYLGAGGLAADSTIGFLSDYLGITFPSLVDDATEATVLNVQGVTGTSLDGVLLGLYGDCPLPRGFDRLTEAPEIPGVNEITTLATYEAGGAGDNGRSAIIKCVQLNGPGPADDGVAIHAGFGVEALLSDASRACLFDRVFTTDFGLGATSFGGCPTNGVDAPVGSPPRLGFELAAARPNPSAEGTSLAWSVPVRGRVRIELYDVLGRRVRTLVDEIVDVGRHERTWDGRTDDGARVSSGIYFAKMTAGEFGATRKLVLLQ